MKTIPSSKLLALAFLLLVVTAITASAQDVDVSKCGDSADNTKKCIAQFVEELRKTKQANQDQVTLLKSRNLGTPKLKTDYETARGQVKNVVTLLTRRNPDFVSIKREFLIAQTKAKEFYKEADTALGTTSGGGFGFGFDSLISWFFDNACKLMPNPLAVAGCNEVVKYLRQLDLKNKANWKAWDKVPNKL
jgi:hypothetical protein